MKIAIQLNYDFGNIVIHNFGNKIQISKNYRVIYLISNSINNIVYIFFPSIAAFNYIYINVHKIVKIYNSFYKSKNELDTFENIDYSFTKDSFSTFDSYLCFFLKATE